MHVLTPLLAGAAFRNAGHVLDYRDKVLKGDEILESAKEVSQGGV
jgi:hypothetical protein